MLKKSVSIIFLLASCLVGNTALYAMEKTVATRSSKRLREKQEDSLPVNKRFKAESSNKKIKVLNAIVLDDVVDIQLLRLQPTMKDIERGNIFVPLKKRKQPAQNLLLTPDSKVKNIMIIGNDGSSVKNLIVNPIVYTNNNHIWSRVSNKR